MLSWIRPLIDDAVGRTLDQAGRWAGRSGLLAGAAAFSGLMVFCGLVFAAIGAFLSLQQTLQPWLAGLLVGGLLALVGLAVLLMLWLSLAKREPAAPARAKPAVEPPETPAPNSTGPADDAAQLGETLGAYLGAKGFRTADVMVAALAAGALLGASPALRDRLFGGKRRSPKDPECR